MGVALHQRAEVIRQEVGVSHGGAEVGVAHGLLDVHRVLPFRQPGGDPVVAEIVDTKPLGEPGRGDRLRQAGAEGPDPFPGFDPP